MWEAIASNQRRSWLLISLMGALLILLGGVIGMYVDQQVGGLFGVAGALALWLILWVTATAAGDSILLSAANAHEIQKADAPQLWNVVEEMTIASGLPKMPRIFVIDDAALNAFAVGRKPEHAAVAVTSGLLKRLSRDELQGVIAHELGHVRNFDIRFMTLASVMVGAVVIISQGFLRAMFYGGGRRRSSSRGGGQAQLILLAAAIVLAIVAPLAAQLLYFSCSRRREFLADASSARFTRYPEGLASALEKISRQAGGQAEVSKVVAPLYIVNPLQEGAVFSLFSTHPKTEERIRILRSMAGAGFAAYEAAYKSVHGRGGCVGQATLQADDAVAVRAPTVEPATKDDVVARARKVGELLDRVSGFVVIPCECGVKLKVPPNFKRDSLACPRCGRTHPVPHAAEAPSAGPASAPMRYHRRGSGWESFRCTCGHTVQIGPTFNAPQIVCPKCNRRIDVTPMPGKS